MKNTKSEYLNPKQALNTKSKIRNIYNLFSISASEFSNYKPEVW